MTRIKTRLICASENFVTQLETKIIRDTRIRKALQKKTGEVLFGSFGEATDYLARGGKLI